MSLQNTHRTLVVCMLLQFVNVTVAAAESGTANDWLRGSGKNLQIRLKGEVHDADGQPATDLQITGGMNTVGSKQKVEPTVVGHRFELWIPVNQAGMYSMWLRIATYRSDRVAYVNLNAYELRQAAIDGLKITLQSPTRHLEVKVVDQGQQVGGATVKIEPGYGAELRAGSDVSGIAHFGLLPDQKLMSLMAWTDDRRIGGYQFDRKPPHDPDADRFEVELSKCHDQKIRFVDGNDKPVPGLELVLQMATAPPNYNFIGTNENSSLKTDAAGEVVYPWFPNWDRHHFYADLNSKEWINDDAEPKTVGDTIIFKVKKRKERKIVEGHITSNSGDAGGFFVTLDSFQGEREHNRDIAYAFTDSDGTFSIDVLPDATYCAFVLDSKWVGKLIDLVPYQLKPEKVTPVNLSVSEGQEVEVNVTSGPSKKPYPNLTVSFQREHDFSWMENKEKQNGTGGPQWWATTDQLGRATTRTLPGRLEVSVYSPLWRIQKQVDVVGGKPVKITLHREVDEKRKVTGRLILTRGIESELDKADVEVGSVDGTSDDRQHLQCNADGTFSFETLASQVGVFGRTKDGRSAGSTIAKNLAHPIEFQLRPTSDFHGQLLGEGDRPLTNHSVRALIHVEGKYDQNAMFSNSFEAKRIESKTDAQGNYTLAGIPTETKVPIRANPVDGSSNEAGLGEIYLEPNDSRPRAVSRLVKAATTPKNVSLAERYKTALRDCRLGGYRLMCILCGPGENVSEFAEHKFVGSQTNENVYSFMQIVIPGDQKDVDAADASFLKERNWSLPGAGHVVAYAIDASGTELGHLEVDVNDNAAVLAAADFIHQHALAIADAEKKWSEAFASAVSTNRRVWARVSQRYCGPCFQLARWLDDNRELLEKDYVMVKIDDAHDKNGQVVVQRLTQGISYGIPYYVIFDSDGKLLINSAGPLGNIGSVSGFEGKKHLRKMLMETRKRLTDAEIDKLVDSVKD